MVFWSHSWKRLIPRMAVVHLPSDWRRCGMELSGLVLRSIGVLSRQTYLFPKIEHRSIVACWDEVNELPWFPLRLLSQTHVIFISWRRSPVIKHIALCGWSCWVHLMRRLKWVDHRRAVWVSILIWRTILRLNSPHLPWPIPTLLHSFSFFSGLLVYLILSWILAFIWIGLVILFPLFLVFCL